MSLVPTDTIGAFVGEPALLVPGAAAGPLAGRSLAVKDVFDVAGTVTGAGNPDFAAGRTAATTTSTAVQRLVDAGASVVGKTVTDELAYSLAGTNVHFGTPVNVNAPGRAPGGSSAGSAAAVAAGLVDLAIGTDTGGSIRVPASYCGIVGWRPTHGAVSVDGVVPLAPGYDTVGLFAREVGLLTTAAGTLLDHESPSDPPQHAVDLMEAMGDRIDLDDALDAFRTLQGAEAWATHGAWITAAQPTFGPGIAARFRAASQVTPEQVRVATLVRAHVTEVLDDLTAHGTVLTMPAAAGPAPLLDAPAAEIDALRAATLRLTCLAGHAGLPVVVVPLGDADGLPLGTAFVGSRGSDLALLGAIGVWLSDAGGNSTP